MAQQSPQPSRSSESARSPAELRAAISAAYFADEEAVLSAVIPRARASQAEARDIEWTARKLVEGVRAGRKRARRRRRALAPI